MNTRATLACGLLLGLAICLLETMDQPIAQAQAGGIWTFVGSLWPIWCATGLGWALAGRAMERRLSGWTLVGATVVTALSFSLLSMLVDRTAPVSSRVGALAPDARACHVAWTNLFYGGLYMAAYVNFRRVARSRWVLARVRQARDESTALLQAARLDAYRHQLQPDTILVALDVLRRQYRDAPAKADNLLDVLVGFLRAAVRGLSGESTTLNRELDVARRYLLLRSLTTGSRPPTAADSARPPPESPFPPRLLMPVLERLCLSGGLVSVHGAWDGGAYRVSVTADHLGPTALPSELKVRMTMNLDSGRPSSRGVLLEDGGRLTWSFEHIPGPVHARPLFLTGDAR